ETDEDENYLMILTSYQGVEFKLQLELGESATSYTPNKVLPIEFLDTEDASETSVPDAVHKKLGRGDVIPLVQGSLEEEPTFSGGILERDEETTMNKEPGYKMRSISISTAKLTFDINTHTAPVSAVGMWLYVPEPEKVSHAVIRLGKKDDSPDYRVSNKDFLDIRDLNKGWNYLRYPTWRNNHTGLRELTSVSVEIVPTQVPTSVTLSEAWLETSEKAKMIFVEDAQFKTFYDIAYPDLLERGIPVTWALRISNIGGETGTIREQMTLNQIREVAKENDNVVTWHSYSSQTSASMTPEETKMDVVNAQKWLLFRGFDGGSFKGAWFQNTAPNHKAAHDYLITSATPYGNSNLTTWPFVNQYEVPRIDLH